VSIKKILQRLILLLVIWTAATITFFIPRISTRNPIRERFGVLARSGGFSPQDMEAIVQSYNRKFGLDKPLLQQYWITCPSLARGDLGVSLFNFENSLRVDHGSTALDHRAAAG